MQQIPVQVALLDTKITALKQTLIMKSKEKL
jgi:hypothetical protein